MTFDPLKPGGYLIGDPITATQINQLNDDIVNAIDGAAGGTYAPSAAIVINGSGLETSVTPSSGNDVTNKTYVDRFAVDVDVFTSSGTWTKPADAAWVEVTVIGGGGGGAAGSATGVGGGGGGSGGVTTRRYQAGDLAATETVTVGAGGAGGLVVELDGAHGGTSTFAASKSYAATGFGGRRGAWNASNGGNGFCGGGGGGTGGAGGRGADALNEATNGGATAGTSVSIYSRGAACSSASFSTGGAAVDVGGVGGGGYGAGGGGAGGSNGGGGGGGAGMVFDSLPAASGGTGSTDAPGGDGADGIVIVTTWRAVS